MNKIYKLIWSSALNIWVVCSELGRASTKSSHRKIIITGFMALNSTIVFAVECTPGVSPRYAITNQQNAPCTISIANDNFSNAYNYLLVRRGNVTFTDDFTLVMSGKSGVFAGNVSGITAQYSPSTITGKNLTMTLNATGFTGNVIGVDNSSANTIKFNDVRITANPSLGSSYSYGLLAGSSTDSGDSSAASSYSDIIVNDATITIANNSGQSAALRAIQGGHNNNIANGNGSTGRITVNGNLTANVSGSNSSGIYVSGVSNTPVVILNGSDNYIKTVNSTNGSAVKLGKANDIPGGGVGQLILNGSLTIDTTQSSGAAIRLIDNSFFDSSNTNSSLTVNAKGSAIHVSNSDVGTGINNGNATSTGAKIYLNQAVLKSTSEDKSLILVNSKQKNVEIKVNKTSDLTASSKAWLLEVQGDSTVDAKFEKNVYLQGLVSKSTVGDLNIELKDNSKWQLAKNNAITLSTFSNLVLDESTLNAFDVEQANWGASNFTLQGQSVNSKSGVINLDNGKVGDKLTIDGNYIASGSAAVKMNTLWNGPGDDVGTNSSSDVLIITGRATGMTTVVPVSANGTLNLIDGNVTQIQSIINTVPVINVETAGTQAFQGNARTTGISQVQLAMRNNSVTHQDEYYWTAKATQRNIEIINPEIPNYTQMPVANMELGYTTLGTLHERRGENQTLAWDDCGTCVKDNQGQSWGRLVGSHLDLEGGKRFNINGEQYLMQLGHDFIIHENLEKQSHNHTGAYISYGRSDMEFEDRYRAIDGQLVDHKNTGNGKTDAFSLGLYNTYYNRNGSYVDLVGQVSHLRNTYNSEGLKEVKQNGLGAVISLEAGRPYALIEHKDNESGWMIEPQAQLIYQYLGLDSFHDDVRTVDQNDQHGLRGRLGIRLARNSEAKDLRTNTVYFTANVLHDFLQQSDINIGPDTINEKYNNTWASVGVGAQLPISQHGYFYADGRYEHSFTSEKRETYKGTLGLKFTWK